MITKYFFKFICGAIFIPFDKLKTYDAIESNTVD